MLLLGLLFSCDNGEKQPLANPTQIDKYFPLKSFVVNQLDELKDHKVRKTTMINGTEEAMEVTLSKEQWRKELDAFIQADINKAANSTAYEEQKNGKENIYRLKPEAKGNIKEIKVTYLSANTDKVKQVTFLAKSKNLFYESSTKGTLTIDESTGVISTYSVAGTQKVWFLSPNEILVKGNVVK
ncbi:hypothetical protein [Echinicola rosea]|uniref:LPS export ABC transporter periplasmic protein LptC n=1 Tax=Echinicola rosea TaxID=1807691 RepID=A0ABQ1V1I0_9BACT|nr:hypothetical protein [Echinicola rosea]GGF34738.1 hypothetical protein GCM10011339_23770 [Echinicola rosea]